jgi:hypothetical protein
MSHVERTWSALRRASIFRMRYGLVVHSLDSLTPGLTAVIDVTLHHGDGDYKNRREHRIVDLGII